MATWKRQRSSRRRARSATGILRRRFHLLGLEGGAPVRNLHARCYLLAEDVIAFFVAFNLETGLEPECVKALRADCLCNPASGTVEFAYVKRCARGSE